MKEKKAKGRDGTCDCCLRKMSKTIVFERAELKARATWRGIDVEEEEEKEDDSEEERRTLVALRGIGRVAKMARAETERLLENRI